MSLPTEKVTKLIDMMNSMTQSVIPAQQPIIEMFELAMDEKMLDYLLKVGTTEYTMEQLEEVYVSMYGEGWEEFKKELLLMSFVHPVSNERKDIYELSPIFPGWIEFYTSGETNEKRAAIIEKFMEFWAVLKKMNKFPYRQLSDYKAVKAKKQGQAPKTTVYPSTGSREIKLDQPLDSKQVVLSKGDVYKLLEKNKDHIGIGNCFCRTHKKLSTGGSCDLGVPQEACFALGEIAEQILAQGTGRRLTYEEACDLLEEFEKKGAIHTAFHYKNDANYDEIVICNCCKDCCLLYSGYLEGGLSKVYTRASYKPEMVDESKCVGCNLCGKYCPTEATYYDKNKKKLVFNYKNCIGCGQCVAQCKFDVRKMVPDQRDVFVKTRKKVIE